MSKCVKTGDGTTKGILLENIFSMMTLRGMEYVIGLLLVPYLVRVLGPEYWGSLVFTQGIVTYADLCITYGFNLTAPRDIAQADTNQQARIFSAVMGAKFLSLVGVTAFLIGVFNVLNYYNISFLEPILFGAAYGSVIGNVLFPIWLFQGLQQMRYITILNLLGRLFSIIGIFLFVKTSEDYVLAALFQACTPIFAGIGAWWLIYKVYPSFIIWPCWKDIVMAYKEGWQIFLSTLAMNLYTASNIVILGLFTNNTIVGYYSGANKIIDCVKRLISPVSEAIYPYISNQIGSGWDGSKGVLKRLLIIFSIGGGLVSIILFTGADFIIELILGEQYEKSIMILKILAIVPLMVSLSNVLGIQTMLPLGMEKIFSRIVITSAVLNTVLIFPLTLWDGANGAALTMTITESFITIAMWIALKKRKIY